MASTAKHPSLLPYLTADLPGVSGAIKRHDDDFIVTELPLYAASGEGTHAYIAIEKRGLTTLAAIRILANKLDRKPQEFGYAGLKDAHAVTRQMLSIEHVDPARLESLAHERIKILSISRHSNKIKLGHLSGNHFKLKIRNTEGSPKQVENRARAVVDILSSRGLPNYFGPQRFGARGDNADVGRAILCEDYDDAIAQMLGRPNDHDQGQSRRARELFDAGDFKASAEAWPRNMDGAARVCRTFARTGGDAKAAWRAVDHTLRKLYLSSIQSELFNRVLAQRLDALDRIQVGDLAWKHRNGACFLVEDEAVEQLRCDSFEISPTGPIFGKKMTDAKGQPGELEAGVLQEMGDAGDSLHAGHAQVDSDRVKRTLSGKLNGARRPLRVPMTDPTVNQGQDNHGPFLEIAFALPPGAYATCLTREVCKTKP